MSRLMFLGIVTGIIFISFVIGYGLLIRKVTLSRRTSGQSTSRREARWLSAMAAIYPLLLCFLSIQHIVAPQRNGVLALTQVLAPYLYLPILLLIPFIFLPRAFVLRAAVAACCVIWTIRFFPSLHLSADRPQARNSVRVLNWNVRSTNERDQQSRVRPVLVERPADIVILEEAMWEWLRRDPAIVQLYPYQFNHTVQASSGLVLLSSYPVLEHGTAKIPAEMRGWPRLVWGRLSMTDGTTLLVVAAHPEGPYSFVGRCRVPPCYDTVERDSLLPHIRAVVDPALQRGEHVLVIGDMNMTEREPAYGQLSHGLLDAHTDVGVGWGHTWGIIPEIRWTSPLLRIEYLLSSPNTPPIHTEVDCRPRGSDHCLLLGTFALR